MEVLECERACTTLITASTSYRTGIVFRKRVLNRKPPPICSILYLFWKRLNEYTQSLHLEDGIRSNNDVACIKMERID